MKTAISLPDELYVEAEKKAKLLGVSRSKLFAIALSEYLQQSADQDITDRLNAVYLKHPDTLETNIAELQRASVDRETW